MGKLTLDVDALKVTTFEPAAAEAIDSNAATVYTEVPHEEERLTAYGALS